MEEKKRKKSYKKITERFCPSLGENAIIVRTVGVAGDTCHCLSQAECKSCHSCEHKRKKIES